MACAQPQPGPDEEFAALQERGGRVMGVDQNASTHRFTSLVDGGRIAFVSDSADPAAVETIRAHLRDITIAFAEGDFNSPLLVHDRQVPGTDVMAERREHLSYAYGDVPGGGAVRITTADSLAL
ncbi:MAG: hypothetical protein ACREL6_10350, partial [Gemmatimonadales bacterium]